MKRADKDLDKGGAPEKIPWLGDWVGIFRNFEASEAGQIWIGAQDVPQKNVRLLGDEKKFLDGGDGSIYLDSYSGEVTASANLLVRGQRISGLLDLMAIKKDASLRSRISLYPVYSDGFRQYLANLQLVGSDGEPLVSLALHSGVSGEQREKFSVRLNMTGRESKLSGFIARSGEPVSTGPVFMYNGKLVEAGKVSGIIRILEKSTFRKASLTVDFICNEGKPRVGSLRIFVDSPENTDQDMISGLPDSEEQAKSLMEKETTLTGIADTGYNHDSGNMISFVEESVLASSLSPFPPVDEDDLQKQARVRLKKKDEFIRQLQTKVSLLEEDIFGSNPERIFSQSPAKHGENKEQVSPSEEIKSRPRTGGEPGNLVAKPEESEENNISQKAVDRKSRTIRHLRALNAKRKRKLAKVIAANARLRKHPGGSGGDCSCQADLQTLRKESDQLIVSLKEQVSEFEEESARLEKSIEDRDIDSARLKKTIEEKEEKFFKYRKDADSRLEASRGLVSELQKEVRKQKETMLVTEQENAQLVGNLKEKISDYEERSARLRKSINDRDIECARLKKTIEEKEEKFLNDRKDADSRLEASRGLVSELQKEVWKQKEAMLVTEQENAQLTGSLKEKISDYEEKSVLLEKSIDDMGTECARLKKTIEEKEEKFINDRKDADSRLEASRGLVSDLQKEIRKLNEARLATEQDNAQLIDKLKEKISDYEEKSVQLEKANKEREEQFQSQSLESASRLEDARQLIEKLREEIRKLKENLAEAQKSDLSGTGKNRQKSPFVASATGEGSDRKLPGPPAPKVDETKRTDNPASGTASEEENKKPTDKPVSPLEAMLKKRLNGKKKAANPLEAMLKKRLGQAGGAKKKGNPVLARVKAVRRELNKINSFIFKLKIRYLKNTSITDKSPYKPVQVRENLKIIEDILRLKTLRQNAGQSESSQKELQELNAQLVTYLQNVGEKNLTVEGHVIPGEIVNEYLESLRKAHGLVLACTGAIKNKKAYSPQFEALKSAVDYLLRLEIFDEIRMREERLAVGKIMKKSLQAGGLQALDSDLSAYLRSGDPEQIKNSVFRDLVAVVHEQIQSGNFDEAGKLARNMPGDPEFKRLVMKNKLAKLATLVFDKKTDPGKISTSRCLEEAEEDQDDVRDFKIRMAETLGALQDSPDTQIPPELASHPLVKDARDKKNRSALASKKKKDLIYTNRFWRAYRLEKNPDQDDLPDSVKEDEDYFKDMLESDVKEKESALKESKAEFLEKVPFLTPGELDADLESGKLKDRLKNHYLGESWNLLDPLLNHYLEVSAARKALAAFKNPPQVKEDAFLRQLAEMGYRKNFQQLMAKLLVYLESREVFAPLEQALKQGTGLKEALLKIKDNSDDKEYRWALSVAARLMINETDSLVSELHKLAAD